MATAIVMEEFRNKQVARQTTVTTGNGMSAHPFNPGDQRIVVL